MLRKTRAGAVIAALIAIAALPARAEQALSLGVFAGGTSTSFNSTPARTGLSLSWLLERGSFGLGGGLRAAQPAAIPLELFVRGQAWVSLGAWSPVLGPELGVSGLQELEPGLERRPRELHALEQRSLGSLYVAFHTEPARFVFGHLIVSALAFDFGTALVPPGLGFRWQLEFLSVGWRG